MDLSAHACTYIFFVVCDPVMRDNGAMVCMSVLYVCICVYVHMYVYMYVILYVRMYLCVYVRMYVCNT